MHTLILITGIYHILSWQHCFHSDLVKAQDGRTVHGVGLLSQFHPFHYFPLFIIRDSEVIMFSPCVFVCLSVYVCHDVCLDDLTMKDWCHTNNILQVHCWGCLVVQVMFHALLTSLMTSQGHKVGQILKLLYLCQYLS